MKHRRCNGFALLIVVILLSLSATAVIVLSNSSSSMLLRTKEATVEANNRNLAASGVAWAKHNGRELSQRESSTVELDVSGLGIKEAKCGVKAGEGEKGRDEFMIKTTFQRGKWLYNRVVKLEPGGNVFIESKKQSAIVKEQPVVLVKVKPVKAIRRTVVDPNSAPNMPIIEPNEVGISIISGDPNFSK